MIIFVPDLIFTYMKVFYCCIILIGTFILSSCDILFVEPDSSDKIVCKGTYSVNSIEVDSLFFKESDIQWYDTTTFQLKLKNPPEYKELLFFRKFKFYAGSDSLFTASLALDIMSSIVSNLVLRYGSYDRKIYLEKSYPNWLNDSITLANNHKRAPNWKRFIDRLDKLNKIR